MSSTGTYQIVELEFKDDVGPISDTKSCDDQLGPVIAILVILAMSALLTVIFILTYEEKSADNDHSFFEY